MQIHDPQEKERISFKEKYLLFPLQLKFGGWEDSFIVLYMSTQNHTLLAVFKN